jgi:hypothetical protein
LNFNLHGEAICPEEGTKYLLQNGGVRKVKT